MSAATRRSGELSAWRAFFSIAAGYDIALGIAFLFVWRPVFDFLGMAAPSLSYYVELPAIFVAVQGLSYAFVVARPYESLQLVRVGVVYKAAYTAIMLWYLVAGGMPSPWFVLFGFLDFLFMLGFLAFLWRAQQQSAGASTGVTA